MKLDDDDDVDGQQLDDDDDEEELDLELINQHQQRVSLGMQQKKNEATSAENPFSEHLKKDPENP